MNKSEIPSEELRQILEELTPVIVSTTLQNMGFTVRDPVEVQQDLAYLRKLRQGAELVKTTTIRTGVGAAITGLIWLICHAAETLWRMRS